MIRLLKLNCHKGHLICCLAYDGGRYTQEEAKSELGSEVKAFGIDPWCFICGSINLAYDDQPTGFTNLDQATPLLRQLSLVESQTRALHQAQTANN